VLQNKQGGATIASEVLKDVVMGQATA